MIGRTEPDMNYYNDNDPFAAQWLRNLIEAGLIPKGYVDERSITEVDPETLRGFTQCHFFAGAGGWSIALELAGWNPGRPVWTGSCPCQPFSLAGNGRGEKDERHLWPEFFRLIQECGPSTVFGEQVESEDGRHWLAAVRLDLEALGYAVGGADLCAASVGAPHVRQRLWWVADTDCPGRPRQGSPQPTEWRDSAFASRDGKEVPNPDKARWADAERRDGSPKQIGREISLSNDAGRWSQHWIPEPEMVRVVHGVHANPRAVGAYGNAIVPQVAAEFIAAYMETGHLERN